MLYLFLKQMEWFKWQVLCHIYTHFLKNTHAIYIHSKWNLKSFMGIKTEILSKDQTGVTGCPKTIMDNGYLNLEIPTHIISNILKFTHTHTKYTCVLFPHETFFTKCFLYL